MISTENPTGKRMATYKWQFAPRFRRHAFGWRSDTPITRIKEALAEIKQVSRQDTVLAAEGAVILLEKLSPALEQVDSSSGALGSAVNRAIATLVPVITKADAGPSVRQVWLQRLWVAFQEDTIPYLEILGDHWGNLCVTPEVASQWADDLLPFLEESWRSQEVVRGFFKGASACMASLYAAGRYEELLASLEQAPYTWWYYRRWGVKSLAAMGKKAEAIQYAEASRGAHDPRQPVAEACEAILLSSGMAEEAYRRYALEANQCTTYLTTFRTIVKKYPHQTPEAILRDLIASTSGSEGKWFAAAKDAGLFDLAIELANRSPTDPRTLIRAAKDFKEKQAGFALACGLAALHWIAEGQGYEIFSTDVLDAYKAAVEAALKAGMSLEQVQNQVRTLASGSHASSKFIATTLAVYLRI